MDLSMTREERLAFLADEPRVAVLSIEAADRGPVSAPVWYTVQSPVAIAFEVAKDSRKADLLAHANRATMCVQSEIAPYRYVAVEGRVEVIGPAPDEFRRAQAVRYLGDEMGELYFASTRDEPALLHVLHAKRWASIDYNKLFA
jgi:nitroimidazol reductase NimA-like FMN-containing flavoprotein (pyridoxamine 5'-phosphate oxidase superfamily)